MPRPSFGCQSCRLRRIKCDEREGGCRNCARFGILCPGYPEAFDVLHRQHIATVPATEAPSALQQQTFPIPSEHLPDANQNLGSPAASISFENDEFALALYYACYCIEGTNRWSMADLQREGNGCLLAAAKLMGYQAMMQKWLVPNANSTLHRSYTIATSLLNEALSTESDRCRDSTLLTVILLGAVETKACSDQSTRSWVAHSRGAATLLQMRGPSQVTSEIGSAMFFQTAHQIFASCLLGKCAVDPSFVELSQAIGEQYVLDPNYPLWRYHWIMIRLINFLAAIPDDLEATLISPNHAEETIRSAMKIQSDMVQLFSGAPQIWQYRTRECHDFEEITPTAQVYQSVTAAQMWNGKRIATVKLYSIIKRIADHQTSLDLQLDPSSMGALAVETINQAAIECLEATPQVVEIARARLDQALLKDEFRICHDAQLSSNGCFVQTQPVQAKLPQLQACLLQWSVYFVAQCPDVQIQVRRHLLYILDYVGDAMHVQQWKLLADKLRPSLV